MLHINSLKLAFVSTSASTVNTQQYFNNAISSYDDKALFTFMPVDPAISIIKQKLEEDSQLYSRPSMSITHITTLLGFCLKNT